MKDSLLILLHPVCLIWIGYLVYSYVYLPILKKVNLKKYLKEIEDNV